jgi:phosphatidylglycerophosphate synthase
VIETRIRPRIDGVLTVVGRILVAAGFRSTHLTLLGLLITVAGAYLIGSDRLVAGGILVAVGSSVDALDGPVARERGTAGPRGAFLDSVTDRISETAMFTGLAFAVAGDPTLVALTVASLGGSLITSYLRALGERHRVDGWAGWMGRSERVILFCAGVISGRLSVMLWIMVVLTWLTVGQRFLATRRRLKP